MSDQLQEPIFSHEDADEKIDFSMPPMSGEEFIKRVIVESREAGSVAFVKMDESKLKSKKPVMNVKALPGCIKAPENIKPTLEWQKTQMRDFSNIRMYIAQMREEIALSKRSKIKLEFSLPDISNEDGWIEICTGADTKKYALQNYDCSPTLTVVLSMSQMLIEQVLEYLVEYLEDQKSIETHLGRWLYALLAAIEMPLHPDTCSNLRYLARACSTIRSQLGPESAKEAKPYNLFICLIARYFRQLDLADE